MKPTKDLAWNLFLLPGEFVKQESGCLWRWEGDDFRAVEVGDVCRQRDRVTWAAWTGGGWREVTVDEGWVVRVTCYRHVGGRKIEMENELCVVEHRVKRDGKTYLVCTPWLDHDRARTVVVLAAIVIPVFGPA